MQQTSSAFSHVTYLAAEIGPRPCGSQNELKALQYCENQLKSVGYKTELQSFKTTQSFSWSYFIIVLVAILGALLSWVKVDSAVALGLWAVLLFIGENTTLSPLVSRIIPKKTSHNLIAKLTEGKPKIVISAHADSAKSGLMFHPRLAKNFRLGFLISFWSLVAIPIIAIIILVAPALKSPLLYIELVPALVLAYEAFQLAERELNGTWVCGANDNASGVSVALEAARKLASANAPVWVVITGAEEAGLFGMNHFIRTHLVDLISAYFINIDNVGKGQLCYTTKEGMLFGIRCSQQLTRLAENCTKSLPNYKSVKPCEFRVMSNDSWIPLIRGLPTITLIALENGVPVNWHWPTDTVENVDVENIETTIKLVESMCYSLLNK
jgi:cytochrome b561